MYYFNKHVVIERKRFNMLYLFRQDIMESIPIEEIEIETRTGTIAAQWWRPKSSQSNAVPIILCHGWQDNAQSFATLIPLLPSQFSYLAIDLLGHGRSSHLAKGYAYHSVDTVSILEQIRRKFQWPKLSFIAHSMGAVICFLYASAFVNNVNLVVALDTLKPQALNPKVKANMIRSRTLKLFHTMELLEDSIKKLPEYTMDELVERVLEGSLYSVNRDKAKYLLARGSKPSPNHPDKFVITRDIRVKYMQFNYMDHKTCLELMKNIKAPYLFIQGSASEFTEPSHRLQESINAFTKCNPRFETMKVKGTHHLHLNTPELISKRISIFLEKYHPMAGNVIKEEKLNAKL